MNRRWATLVSLILVAYAGLAITWQIVHRTASGPSIIQSFRRGEQLAQISSIVERDRDLSDAAALDRKLDLALPPDARVFVMDMTGPTNYAKIGYYFYLTYYLFPREVAVSIDQPTHLTKDGFTGRTAASDEEVTSHGFDVRLDLTPDAEQVFKMRPDLPLRNPVNPGWFSSDSDTILAFLLPALTALSGMWLFRLIFPSLTGQTPLPEQLAYGLGLGMMAVAALTLGIKLCGFHGARVIFLATALGSFLEVWRHHKFYRTEISGGGRKLFQRPTAVVIAIIGVLIFLVLFRLAGLQGLTDPDALRWMLKAKIIHLYTGSDIVHWFSNPRLAHAHLDYPTLVPSLHAATYDSLGHVDEFVTKFWSTWMLLLLLGALAAMNRGGNARFGAPGFALLSLLLLPAILWYVQTEGGTMPMIYFTVLGFVQCGLWLVAKDPARLGLGLTLLFGAAMTKFEGFIFLGLVGGWMLLLPSARPALKWSSSCRRALAFWVVAALPFIWLRVQIPALHFESGWAGYALHHPASTLSTWPGIFLVLLTRFSVAPALARWSGDGGHLHWVGSWDGPMSLFNQNTLGLPWLCVLMTIALWFAVPARRQVVVWILVMLLGALAAFSLVFTSFISVTSLPAVIAYTVEEVAGRYLLPVLLAWFAALLTLSFLPQAPAAAAPEAGPPAPGQQPERRFKSKNRKPTPAASRAP